MTTITERIIEIDKQEAEIYRRAQLAQQEAVIAYADQMKYNAMCIIERQRLWRGQYKTWEYYRSEICGISSKVWKAMCNGNM